MKRALVQYLDESAAIDCPFGQVRRVITGGTGGVANVHVVSVSRGTPRYHEAYDEVYYVLSGTGKLVVESTTYALRPGAVAVIPAKAMHSLESDGGAALEFIIFGVPPADVTDDCARPRKPNEACD